jgi:hypothetical protein
VLQNQKGYFERKRLSDNVFDEKQRIGDEVIKEIFDKKEKTRKGHNVSVTTNTSTTSTTTINKKSSVNYG